MKGSVLGLRASGRTALWDAVGFGLDSIGQGKNRKKVLVVVTDGDDNRSRLTFRELLESVRERDVLIYSVGMGGAPKTLSQLAEATGARAHFPRNLKQCREAMKEIGREVSQHYSLGYYPTSVARDGKWRSIRVAVGPPGSGHVVRTRAGYYARVTPLQPGISTVSRSGSAPPSVR